MVEGSNSSTYMDQTDPQYDTLRLLPEARWPRTLTSGSVCMAFYLQKPMNHDLTIADKGKLAQLT